MRLWIDDLRAPPDDTWTWVQSSAHAIALLEIQNFDIISFDHDLGGNDTAMRVVDWLDEVMYFGLIPTFEWRIHSANPVGRLNLAIALERICNR
jgi:hypothetical protein